MSNQWIKNTNGIDQNSTNLTAVRETINPSPSAQGKIREFYIYIYI